MMIGEIMASFCCGFCGGLDTVGAVSSFFARCHALQGRNLQRCSSEDLMIEQPRREPTSSQPCSKEQSRTQLRDKKDSDGRIRHHHHRHLHRCNENASACEEISSVTASKRLRYRSSNNLQRREFPTLILPRHLYRIRRKHERVCQTASDGRLRQCCLRIT